MRIAMIGLGDIACKAYLPLVANHADITPILCTRNSARLAELAQQYRITETCTNLSALFALKPDAVMIHSDTDSHAELASQCLYAGIPTFIDKPLSYHLLECETLLNLAEQKNIPLAVGFNRRYAPLIQSLTQQTPMPTITQIILQKNRVNQADETRRFIYDDFIHVLDTLRFLAPGSIENLQVSAQHEGQLLAAIQVHWQVGKASLSACMNRISGVTEERLEFFAAQQKWQIDSLTSGVHWHNNHLQPLGFNDWESTLYKRGFVTLLNNWMAQVSNQTMGDHEDILATHTLCEDLVKRVES
jgi:virulence factor